MLNSVYGSPFYNLDSGYNTSGDHQNNHRLKIAWRNYLKTVDANPELKAKFTNSLDHRRVQIVKYAAPLTGLLLMKVFTDSYCSPRFFYFRYFLMLNGLLAGYKYSTSYQEKYKLSQFTRNFHLFPDDLKKAIADGDSRYVRNWQVMPDDM